MDWLDLLAVQGTLKSLLQHHISKTSILHGYISEYSEYIYINEGSEAPILWPLDVKSQLIGKDPDAGKD